MCLEISIVIGVKLIEEVIGIEAAVISQDLLLVVQIHVLSELVCKKAHEFVDRFVVAKVLFFNTLSRLLSFSLLLFLLLFPLGCFSISSINWALVLFW